MKRLALATIILVTLAFWLGFHADPKAGCVRQYRQNVIDCVTDSECEAADNDLLDCVNEGEK